jgi:prepilin-type N-terminal cleavage/methylation domain-containing protein
VGPIGPDRRDAAGKTMQALRHAARFGRDMDATPLPFRTRAGMSLIEVMIALVVMVTGVMSLFGAMGTANDVRNRSRYHGNALEALQAQIESQLTQGISVASQVPMAPNGTAFAIAGIPVQPGQLTAGRISREADSTSNLVHLTFTAAWQDSGGPTSLVLHYYLSAR